MDEQLLIAFWEFPLRLAGGSERNERKTMWWPSRILANHALLWSLSGHLLPLTHLITDAYH